MQANTDHVQPGYYVLSSPRGSPIKIPINEECAMPRSATRPPSKMDPRVCYLLVFIIRERGGCCVVTGSVGPNFIGLEAAHILPLAHLDLWRSRSRQQQIADDKYDGETGMHSVQNGNPPGQYRPYILRIAFIGHQTQQ
ncbi:hypothetical protein BJY52DRAFT_1293536 [Lactarius psammicola]|nr:hypothetical protein BJY52DRAFT_1293536 [Lactarius psammicola]